MQTYSFAVGTRCTKCYNYTTWQNSRKWFYVGAVIKISVLIFHLHKINLWKNINENEHSLREFFLALWCTCSLHLHVYSTLPSKARRAHSGVNAHCCCPAMSLVFHCVTGSAVQSLTSLLQSTNNQERQADKLKMCLQNVQKGNVMWSFLQCYSSRCFTLLKLQHALIFTILLSPKKWQ